MPLHPAVRHEGLEPFEREISRSSNRIAVAMVTLGLYVAASLLMLHSIGARLFGDVPLLAVVGYGFALWLSWRLVRSVGRTGGH
jgi:ubiquinone biosynthesis protein